MFDINYYEFNSEKDISIPLHLYERGFVYDVECYRNLFMVSGAYLHKLDWSNGKIVLPITEEVFNRAFSTYYYYEPNLDKQVNSYNDLNHIFSKFKYLWWIGYNNYNYDDALMHHYFYKGTTKGFGTKDLYDFSNEIIINRLRNPYRYKDCLFDRSYDLLELIRKGYKAKGLKSAATILNYPKLQDLPIKYDKFIEYDDLELLKQYNLNDVAQTIYVFNEVTEELYFRDQFVDIYKIKDLYSLSDSAICKKIFRKQYIAAVKAVNPNFSYMDDLKGKYTSRPDVLYLADIILDKIKFNSIEFKRFLHALKGRHLKVKERTPARDSYDLSGTESDYSITFYGRTYTIAKGGIHSVDEPAYYADTPKKMLLDLDVTSQYPTTIVANWFCPEHLNAVVFLSLLAQNLEDRKVYKAKAKEDPTYFPLQLCLKIVLNTVYGLFNSKTFWLFDPLVTYKVTFNNQLFLLMLVEQLSELGRNDEGAPTIEVISANTDGILLYLDKDKYQDVKELYAEWEAYTGFALEETFYDVYARRDVNNYIARTFNGKVKTKGQFLLDIDLTKGFDSRIVSIALKKYFLDGIDYVKTITEHTDIYDFCILKQIDEDKFNNYLIEVYRKYRFYNEKSKKPFVKPRPEDIDISETNLQKSVRFYVRRGLNYHSIKKTQEEVNLKYEELKLKLSQTTKNKEKKEIKESIIFPPPVLVYGHRLIKRGFKKNSEEESDTDFAANHLVQLFNDYFPVDNFANYQVDYDYYIDRVKKIVDVIDKNRHQ